MKQSRLISEMQLLTGIMTEDVDYLVYLLLKDGEYFKNIEEKEEPFVEITSKRDISNVTPLDEWLNGLEEV